MAAVAGADASARIRLLIESAPLALRECGCGGADIDAIEVLLSHLARTDERVFGALRIPAGSGGTTLPLARTDTAADLAARLADRATAGAAVQLRLR